MLIVREAFLDVLVLGVCMYISLNGFSGGVPSFGASEVLNEESRG